MGAGKFLFSTNHKEHQVGPKYRHSVLLHICGYYFFGGGIVSWGRYTFIFVDKVSFFSVVFVFSPDYLMFIS